jgi:hypothetical protein
VPIQGLSIGRLDFARGLPAQQEFRVKDGLSNVANLPSLPARLYSEPLVGFILRDPRSLHEHALGLLDDDAILQALLASGHLEPERLFSDVREPQRPEGGEQRLRIPTAGCETDSVLARETGPAFKPLGITQQKKR